MPARTSKRPVSPRTRTRRRNARRRAVRAGLRSSAQMLTVLVGGVAAGGLLVLAALPHATEPLSPLLSVAGAGLVALATALGARRLRPRPTTRRR